MKKMILIAALFIVLTAAGLQAQGGPMYSSPYGGFKIMGGLTSASMSYTAPAGFESFDAFKKPVTSIGGGIGFESGGIVGIELDVLYLRKGIRFQGTTMGVNFDVAMNLDEITVPVLLKAHLLNQSGLPDVYLMGGGEAGYIVQAQSVYTASGPSIGSVSDTADIKENINRVDYGLVFGAGVGLNLGGIKLFIEGRYHLGLAEIQKNDTGFEGVVPSNTGAKTNVLAFFAGLKF